MPKKAKRPFDKIMLTRSKLDLYVRYGDNALGDQTLPEFITDVHEAFGWLMDFRNIINAMVGFDEAPTKAVLPYLPDWDGEVG